MSTTSPTPGVLCCWASLPSDDARTWYEDDYIPRMRTKSNRSLSALHCEVTASGMETEPVGRLDSPWPYMTCYDIRNIDAATKQLLEAGNQPAASLFDGILKDSRFDIRTYREVKCWQDEEWDGDIQYVASVAAMEWHVTAAEEAEVVQYYTEQVGPTIASSPDVLRFRFFKIDSAVVQVGAASFAKEKETLHTYFTLVELESEEWPWDVVVDLAADGKWGRYFESQIVAKWQLSHFLVKRAYTDETEDDKEAGSLQAK